MNFFKALISWKLWLSIVLGIALIVGLWFLSFKFLNEFTNHGVEVSVPDLSDLTIQQAMKKLDELNLRYEVDSIKFTEEHPPFSILEFFPSAGAKVKPGRRIFIKSNPSTWRPVELPDLIDKSKRLALTQLHMRGFVVGDTIYIEDPAKDAVLAVLYGGDTIPAGKLLPKGSVVDLILGRGFNMDMPVPNVEGMSLTQARRILKNQFFDMGQIYYFGNVRDTAVLRVVYQDPPPLDLYDEGLPVSLWLSTSTRAGLKRQIDSLDLVYRRKLDEKDSLFYNSIESSKSINISDLPEEIRNQVKYDQNINQGMRPDDKPKSTPSTQGTTRPRIDTTGISIE
ncbi:MAG: PASTA domain-containing protein [Flavobacteriaceae bacterium]|nr:PASTA domain-containing protein [Flavobacteriaceae bacterium]